MAKIIEVKCGICGQSILRAIGEVNRTLKRGGTICCSKSCQGKICIRNIPQDANRDDFSPFRRHLNSIKNGKKRRECCITLQDLKDQWDKQKGICPYTGWQLFNPPTTYRVNELNMAVNKASVDRIDSSKEYAKDNIQFVALIAQLAKNQWTSNDLIDFCKAVVFHQSNSFHDPSLTLKAHSESCS